LISFSFLEHGIQENLHKGLALSSASGGGFKWPCWRSLYH